MKNLNLKETLLLKKCLLYRYVRLRKNAIDENSITAIREREAIKKLIEKIKDK